MKKTKTIAKKRKSAVKKSTKKKSAKLAKAPAGKAKAKTKAKPKAKKPAPTKTSRTISKEPSAVLLTVGNLAPDFQAPTETGETIRLSDFRGKRVILYFYPKDDTPGCTKESCDFRDHFGRLRSLQAEVFGISKDSVQSHQKFKTKYGFPFPLLSDANSQICESYGVWKEKSMYGRKYMGIERTTFILDEQGRISKIFPKVSVTGHVQEILDFLAVV
jgi:peroxiredoxin Q/BCP